ncbi:DUF2714 domain-containing protein [Mesomycoplasma hyorhinis]|uniref:DUF2714 domain-containing protein n=1 Tax=Mesomycoplasma hyorhinis TaxID=2100 RepID=UPI00036B145F|nr:DUF2714 domain-containing protein [Mesomycoplasma hyorhinis]MXR08591.1 DUF2714 domain-containing protein [Mesomycoplasma hyorhinis]QPC29627.1 DUF2714 domain-containing protein [Mesomycoplasma hyorhinis]UVT32273.1 DUF2714 domain-containing protein [Mesomycoplasma hyorhinis]UVT32950.1 DUF2714 domain-containing protein [Mesomycoplasma hyorhinis]UVT33626.1 DUF2714 domain-containing protein [Mesomycoplasma hyorhinis]
MKNKILEMFSLFSFKKKKNEEKLEKSNLQEYLVFDNQTKIEVVDLYKNYKLKRQTTHFVSYDQLYSYVLLKTHQGFHSELYKKYEQNYKNALANKRNLEFSNFVISFNLDLKYSQKLLVPIVITKGTSNDLAINFVSSSNLQEQTFFNVLNQEIVKLLNAYKTIEIFPGLLLFKGNDASGSLKTLFSKDFISVIKR